MNFLQKIKNGAGKVTDRAQNVVEIGKLNTQISNIEREMGLYYQRMGEVFYEGYRLKDMSKAEKEMVELAKTCDLLAEERDDIRSKIANLKNERLCYQCGKVVAEDAMFCPYCGEKLLKPKAKEFVSSTEAVKEQSASILSPVLEDDDIFKSLYNSTSTKIEDTVLVTEPQATPANNVVDQEAEARRQRELDRERERQEELDRRIRTWKENVNSKEPAKTVVETAIPTSICQICSTALVKGTKWCPHCGSEQI
ncbi:zinc-ribbon domain-containing protein [Fontibacillus panacisegetis]|uniref:Zinc-ribbon domain-containing protein n=1 Tax=Fontibacillus panacisegetis TaxID=670482 RepID=A0A1G7S963_9BACL|nr:zinc ribbon domain-containing protein [Fontibacillus panacisegetis]SDG19533.1 zinc-ribbon domain-containing protein [Fontibacillus panacisegetis]